VHRVVFMYTYFCTKIRKQNLKPSYLVCRIVLSHKMHLIQMRMLLLVTCQHRAMCTYVTNVKWRHWSCFSSCFCATLRTLQQRFCMD